MSNGEHLDKRGIEGELPGQQSTNEQETLKRLQSDIEEQGHRVTRALNSITEDLHTGGNISLAVCRRETRGIGFGPPSKL